MAHNFIKSIVKVLNVPGLLEPNTVTAFSFRIRYSFYIFLYASFILFVGGSVDSELFAVETLTVFVQVDSPPVCTYTNIRGKRLEVDVAKAGDIVEVVTPVIFLIFGSN